jgi:hypothetical protein
LVKAIERRKFRAMSAYAKKTKNKIKIKTKKSEF